VLGVIVVVIGGDESGFNNWHAYMLLSPKTTTQHVSLYRTRLSRFFS